MVIAIILVVAGYCLMFGDHGVVGRLFHAALGLAIMFMFAPGILYRLRLAIEAWWPSGPGTDAPRLALLTTTLLTLLGFAAWRTRVARSRARAERRRFRGARERAKLPPPETDEIDVEEGGGE